MKSSGRHGVGMATYAIVLLTGLTLINLNHWFIYPTQSSYFFFTINTSLLFIATASNFLLSGKTISLKISMLPVSMLTLYVLLHGLLNSSNGFNSWHYYYLSAGLLFIAIYSLLANKEINKHHIETGFTGLAVIEAVICFAQYAGLFKSMNTYFVVSGSWVNPNVTAMFMALVFPIAFLRVVNAQNRLKIFYALIFCLLLGGLYLLKCRSAYLGVFTSGILCCYFCFWEKFKNNKAPIYTIAVILLICVIPIIIYLYKSKKESADGRLLVYKTTWGMITDKPVQGHGFGLFEKYYNLKQATYFNEGHATVQENPHAGHINMAYNELLQHGAEGGFPGLILFVSVFAVLLYRGYCLSDHSNKPHDYHLIAAYSGVAGYFLMSLVNFTWQAIPATCIFIFYAAILTDCDKSVVLKKVQTVIIVCLLFSAIGLLYQQAETVKASYRNRTAIEYIKQRKAKEAIYILEPLKETLDNDESFWNNLARSYFISGKYQGAIEALEKAQLQSSKPAIFHLKARCYEKLGMTEQAITSWQAAALIEPNRMLPHYHLMNLYLGINDPKNALLKARQLTAFKPKGISEKATVYKRKAEQVLAGLGSKN